MARAGYFPDVGTEAERRAVWSSRLAAPTGGVTVLAEDDGRGLAGFVHVIPDEDAEWGRLVENLHVAYCRRWTGIGTALLARAGRGAAERAAHPAAYLRVCSSRTLQRSSSTAPAAASVGTRRSCRPEACGPA